MAQSKLFVIAHLIVATSAVGCGGDVDPTTLLTTASCGTTSSWTGVKTLGASGKFVQSGTSVLDSSGSLYNVGYTNASLGGTFAGSQDVFVIKYDASGTKQWTRQLGASGGNATIDDAALDTSANLYASGTTYAGLDGNSLTGVGDALLVKYDTSGTRQWTRQLGVSGASTFGRHVTTDSSGNVYMSGFTQGALDGNSFTGSSDFIFLTRYSAAGVKQWTKTLGGASGTTYTSGEAVATDSSGNIYVTGYTSTGLGGNTVTGNQDHLIVKYNSSGTVQWVRQLGVATKNAAAVDVALDSSGNIYTVGNTNGAIGGNALTGSTDVLITKYDSAGTLQWVKLLGAPSKTSEGYRISLDPSSNIYITGQSNGVIGGVAKTGTQDAFIAKYDSSGTRLWLKTLGAASSASVGYGVAADCNGAYLTGYSSGGVGGNSLIGTLDTFYARYSSEGVLQ